MIPVRAIEDKVARAAARRDGDGHRLAEPRVRSHLEVSERLAAAGYDVVPHLSARMIRGQEELAAAVQRLRAAGISEAFVVGGDASPPAGDFVDAEQLLEALAGLPDRFTRVGVGGYPEGHPVDPDHELREALLRKQEYADYVATQICFDAAVLEAWIEEMRGLGLRLPVVVGLPGVVDRKKLAEVSLQTGVGASVRYLMKHGRQVARLMRQRTYDPTPLAGAVAARLDRPGLGHRGRPLFTFNQVDATRDWVGHRA